MKRVDVSIILLTRNAGKQFKLLLDRIYSQADVDFEVILIDTASEDETLEIADHYPIDKIQSVEVGDFGHGKTRNLGAELAGGKYVVYIAQDALPVDDSWASNLVHNLDDPRVAGVFGRQIPQEGSNPPDRYSYKEDYPDRREVLSAKNSSNRNVVFSDVNSALRREVLISYPFLDELLVSEDNYWGNLVISKGYHIVYEPKAAVIHSHIYTIPKIVKLNFDQGIAYSQMTTNHDSTLFARNSLKRFRSKVRFLWKERQYYWVLYVLVVDALRFGALNLGKRHKYLPRILKRTLSNFDDKSLGYPASDRGQWINRL
jgi:rhamnosyltransferase